MIGETEESGCLIGQLRARRLRQGRQPEPGPERQAERLSALAESGRLFAEATTDLTRLLNLIARHFAELVGDCTNIRLIEGDHDIDCKIDGIGAMQLKSEFVKLLK